MFKSGLQSSLNKIIATTFVMVFLFVSLFSLFHMSFGMNMESGTSDCPFMSHEETLCAMNVLDHLGAWQATFLATIPTLTLLFSILAAAIIILSIAPNLLQKLKCREPDHLKRITERTYLFPPNLWQELFSNGILNPKLF